MGSKPNSQRVISEVDRAEILKINSGLRPILASIAKVWNRRFQSY